LTAYTALDVLLPYDQGQLVSVFHEKGHVQSLEHTGKGILISGYIPKEIQAQFTPYLHRANKRN
jgi:GTP-binding protein HflX